MYAHTNIIPPRRQNYPHQTITVSKVLVLEGGLEQQLVGLLSAHPRFELLPGLKGDSPLPRLGEGPGGSVWDLEGRGVLYLAWLAKGSEVPEVQRNCRSSKARRLRKNAQQKGLHKPAGTPIDQSLGDLVPDYRVVRS